MSKEVQRIRKAWLAGEAAKSKSANTHTDGQVVYLHGSPILKREQDGKIKFTLASYNSVTTRRRLAQVGGIIVRNKLFVPHYLGKEIKESEWYDSEGA